MKRRWTTPNRLFGPLALPVCIAGGVTVWGVASVAQRMPADRFVLAENGRLHLELPPGRGSVPQGLPKEVGAGDYSPDYARRTLVPGMGGSIAVGDYNGDGKPDLYAAVPGGSNGLFRNNGDGTFRNVTAEARVSGPEGALSATFCDYDRSGRQSLLIAGAAGITGCRNNGD